jgi:predicted MFS family arabinose efflux permease
MPSPLTDLPDALDEATAASLQARREKLVRRVRNQRIRMYIALGLSGCVALFALAAYLIGDHAAARSSAMTAYLVFGFTCITGVAARKRAVDALRETDQFR